MDDAGRNEWDDYADGWDQDAAARAYAAGAFGSLHDVLATAGATLDGAAVIDFGCGTGLLTERLAPVARHVVAVDTSTAMLAVLRAKIAERGWRNVTATTDLPTEAPGRDLVVCSSVCAFVDDYPATVRRLVALLRPGGLFVQWDWERTDDPEHPGLTRVEIGEALREAGLEDIAVDIAFDIAAGDQTMSPLIGTGRRPQRAPAPDRDR